jgi:orotidine-5'-phosphate decarboxylase
MYEHGLLKFSNARDLPLKSGGTTDVYINVRDARNTPEGLNFLSDLYAIPLNRMRPDRFAEIPDSVSCIAGPLSIKTGIPYLTIREKPKEGRVADATIIGNFLERMRVWHIDDVITNGQSKVAPWLECQKRGLINEGLVVLVDRQQGWKEYLVKAGLNINVWPGMTLHDVRRELISHGLMQRCSPKTEDQNPLIVALDGKGWDEILPLIDCLRTTGCILKVNDLLFGEGIDRLMLNLSVYGRVMADLKCHDIPNTVFNTCRRLRACPPWAVTVHASGGGEMIKAAHKALEGTPTITLCITLLTSIGKESEEIFRRRPMREVLVLAKLAYDSGARGFVCSPEETATLRKLYPDAVIVNPGIRSEGKDKHDQQRTATPAGAMEAGANFLVMGRQLLQAKDSVAEVNRVLTEELGIAI